MDNIVKLQEIKKRIENQMIFLEGHKEDINFKSEVEWLIKRVETLQSIYKSDVEYYMKENQRLMDKNNKLIEEMGSKVSLD